MIRIIEKKGFDLEDYIDSTRKVVSNICKVFFNLTNKRGLKDIFETKDNSQKVFDYYKQFKNSTEEALGVFENELIKILVGLDNGLEDELKKNARNPSDKKSIVVSSMNQKITDLNLNLARIENFKKNLPINMNNLVVSLNSLIQDLNNAMDKFDKVPKADEKKLIKIKKIK